MNSCHKREKGMKEERKERGSGERGSGECSGPRLANLCSGRWTHSPASSLHLILSPATRARVWHPPPPSAQSVTIS